MLIPLGHVRELVRYPVKSMAGTPADSVPLGWHGLAGDRRYAFRRSADRSGFPWLTASRAPELLLYRPSGLREHKGDPLPTHVCTPTGAELELGSIELEREIAGMSGETVDLMSLRHGIFDDAPVSLIGLATIAEICRAAGVALEPRRFRPNIVLETERAEPFLEDGWIGARLLFGDRDPRPAVHVALRDLRCMMINLDPDTARQDPALLRTAVALNQGNAGVYATVVQTGEIWVGMPVSLERSSRGS